MNGTLLLKAPLPQVPHTKRAAKNLTGCEAQQAELLFGMTASVKCWVAAEPKACRYPMVSGT